MVSTSMCVCGQKGKAMENMNDYNETPSETETVDMNGINEEVRDYFKKKQEKAEKFVNFVREFFDTDSYWEVEDFIIVRALKSQFESMIKDPDYYETPDNVAADLAAMARVLKFFMVHTEYDDFMMRVRDGAWRNLVNGREHYDNQD